MQVSGLFVGGASCCHVAQEKFIIDEYQHKRGLKQGNKMELKLLLILFLAPKSHCQCTQDLEMPPKSNENRDTSGLRPNKSPPIPVGDTVTYQCPPLKSIKGKSSFSVKCNDLLQYVFPPELASWGECQCNGDLTAQCPGLRYDIK